MKPQELKKLINEEIRKVINKSTLTEAATKTILGIEFKVVPIQAGMKFEFKNAKKFLNSNVSVNALVSEIQSMLDKKFGKGLFIYRVRGGMVTNPGINGLEFVMNANQFFKDLDETQKKSVNERYYPKSDVTQQLESDIEECKRAFIEWVTDAAKEKGYERRVDFSSPASSWVTIDVMSEKGIITTKMLDKWKVARPGSYERDYYLGMWSLLSKGF